MPPTEELSWPGVYALHVVHLASRLGVASEALLDGLDLEVETLVDPDTRLTTAETFAILGRAQALTRDPALGMRLGLEMCITWHGFLGYAALSAATLGDALTLAERYGATRCSVIGFGHRVDAGQASLVLEERVPLGELRELVVTAIFVGLARMGAALVARPLVGRAEVSFARPAYFAEYAPALPFEVRFEQPLNRMLFDAQLLSLPIPTADPVALRQATDVCERELSSLRDPGRTLARLRTVLIKEGGGFHGAEEAAAMLHVSPRTLRRQLAAMGTTFSALLDDARRDLALALIENRSLSLEGIAEAVGYSDVPNFTRAFRRWTGVTPGAYRRR